MHRTSPLLILLLCAPAGAAEGKFAGKWNTDYGLLTMTQDGNKVKGVYYDGTASLEGTVEKNRLTFTYTEPGLEGDGEFELAADGKSFTGKWRSKGGQTWNGWNGKLAGEVPAARQGEFAGTWETTYGVLILTQDGKKVRGSYYNGQASLEGTVEKGRLTFTFVETIGKGDGEFVLSADGKSFTGKWRWENQNTWHGWDGSRPAQAPRP
jgi:hypothetical protein